VTERRQFWAEWYQEQGAFPEIMTPAVEALARRTVILEMAWDNLAAHRVHTRKGAATAALRSYDAAERAWLNMAKAMGLSADSLAEIQERLAHRDYMSSGDNGRRTIILEIE
jgi:hypothetical protein